VVSPVDTRDTTRLIEAHLDLAIRAARMVYPRVKAHVEFDDLVALATTGLAEAAQRYDAQRGASFQTFAWYRTQGAIYDGLRRMTQLPKRVWVRILALRAATEYLEHRGERDAGARRANVPEASGADALASIKSAMSAIRTMYVTSLDAIQEAGFDAQSDDVPVGEHLDSKRLRTRLREAIDQLPERERELMTKVYWEGKSFVDAAGEIGVSKSWASRLHAQAVDRLRGLVDDS